jgi:hypothetical protein
MEGHWADSPPRPEGPLLGISAAGGEPEAITGVQWAGETAHLALGFPLEPHEPVGMTRAPWQEASSNNHVGASVKRWRLTAGAGRPRPRQAPRPTGVHLARTALRCSVPPHATRCWRSHPSAAYAVGNDVLHATRRRGGSLPRRSLMAWSNHHQRSTVPSPRSAAVLSQSSWTRRSSR